MTQQEMYVGIDVSSKKLDVSFLDGAEKHLRQSMTVENGRAGWKELKDTIVAIADGNEAEMRVVCGMESTGNFHKCLENELRREKRLDLDVRVLNPMGVKYFGKALLKDSKTDQIDSILIAKYLKCINPKPGYRLREGVEELREGTRTRRSLIEERTQHKNRMHKLLRVHLPGYRQLLGKELTKQLLVVLSEMPSPDKILERTVEQISTLQTGKRHYVRPGFAEKLRELAEQAPRQRLYSATSMLLRMTACRILELDGLIAELDGVLEAMARALYPDQYPLLLSIPGIGKVSAAAILAEVDDIKRFASSEDFVGYCGLYPVVWQSGDGERRYKMTYKGNRMLKLTFLVASSPARLNNPVVAAFYERLCRRGQSAKSAGGASARKLAELVYAILSKNEPWSDDIAQRGMAKGAEMAKAATLAKVAKWAKAAEVADKED